MTLLLIFSPRAATAALAQSWRCCRRPCSDAGDGMLESIRRYAAYRAAGQRAGLLARGSGAAHRPGVYLGAGLGIALPLATYFAFVPLILLVMLLPVTFNGIGTSQAAFVWFFGRAGVPAAPAFALSVLFVALGVVGNLPGGLLYTMGHARANPRTEL